MDKTIPSDFNTDQENEEQLLDSEETLEQESNENSVDDDEVARLRSENKKLTEIIKRRKEREAEKATTDQPKQDSINPSNGLSREEAILIASGMTGEDLDYLNVVAKGTSLPIGEAKEHPLFKTYLETREAEKRAKRAKLGASKGSSVTKPSNKAGLTAEEHKKLWEESLGK